MKQKVMIWMLGVLIVVSAIGIGFGANIASAADQGKPGQMMMQDPKAMASMMQSPDMQQQCIQLMKNPEMQKAMIGLMKQPEMQAAMKQMLQRDMGFHQMMLDLVNSVDMNMEHGQGDTQTMPGGSMPMDHSGHHM